MKVVTLGSQQTRTRENDKCKTTSSHAHDETNGGGRGTLTEAHSDVPLCILRTRATVTTQPNQDERSSTNKHDGGRSGGGRGAFSRTYSDVTLSIRTQPNHDDEKYTADKYDESTGHMSTCHTSKTRRGERQQQTREEK